MLKGDSPINLQNIPPECARLCLRTERFVREELKLDLRGRSVLLALSGGPDSNALLLIFALLRSRLGLKLHAAYLNHLLRDEADQEARFVRHLCDEYNVDCFLGKSRIAIYALRMKMGLEQAARVVRYRFLHGLASRNGYDFIFTGHHLNDLAEDVLMRILRGSGWPGLAGMRAVNGCIVRPLLLMSKEEIYFFLKELRQKWVEDKSNTERAFLRNRIRHDILPLFFRENPNFLDQIAVLWKQGSTDRDFFSERIADLLVYKQENEICFNGRKLRDVHPALRLRAYKKALEKLGPGQPLFKNIEKLDKAWLSGRGGRCIQFPGGKQAWIKSGDIMFKVDKNCMQRSR